MENVMTDNITDTKMGLGIACEILTTKDLVLRPPQKDDVQDIALLANNYNVASMLESMPYPYLDTHAEEFIERVSKPSESGCHYAITHAETGQLMGICSLSGDNRRYDLPYIGYWLGEEFWGKGYATQAARALVDLFFKAGSEDTLLISVLADNVASQRVIEKFGGRYWKQDTHYSAFLEKDCKVDHYRITRENWMGAVAA